LGSEKRGFPFPHGLLLLSQKVHERLFAPREAKSVVSASLTGCCYCRKKSMSGFLLLGKRKASFPLPSRIYYLLRKLSIRAPMLGRDDNVLLRKLSIRAPMLGRDDNVLLRKLSIRAPMHRRDDNMLTCVASH